MRLITTLLLSCLCATAYAAEPPRDAPPPPPLDNNESPAGEPQVVITRTTNETVEEYRANGQLYMIKIIPKIGKPYYLVDDQGDGKFARQEGLDSGVRPPRWVLHRF